MGVVATDPTIDNIFTRHWTTEAHKLAWAPAVQTILTGILEFVGSRKPWRDISNADVAAYVEHRYALGVISMQGKGENKVPVRVRDLSPATVNRALAVWQRAHKRARDEWEYDTRPIAWTMHKDEEPAERVRAISPDEARRLLIELPLHMQWLVAFSLCTGARRNELFTLTWDRIDLANREAHVVAKGRRGLTRPLALTVEALAILGAQPKGRAGDYVFETTNWRKHYAAGLDRAGIEDFRWHDLRHTFATWAGRAGVPLEVASKALGHSGVDVTMRYRHVFADEVANALTDMPTLGVTNVETLPVTKSPHELPTLEQKIQEKRRFGHD
jgi:integrase